MHKLYNYLVGLFRWLTAAPDHNHYLPPYKVGDFFRMKNMEGSTATHVMVVAVDGESITVRYLKVSYRDSLSDTGWFSIPSPTYLKVGEEVLKESELQAIIVK
jgi:hypothetical protein